MRVAVDARSLRAPGTGRGIAVYLERLLAELGRAHPEDSFESVTGGRLWSAAGALLGRPRLDRAAGRCDVAWLPAPAPVAVSPSVPYVMTVHDLSFEHRRADYRAYDRLWVRIARPHRLAQRAARVIAVSEAVRREVVAEWRVRAGGALAPKTRRPPPAGAPPRGRARGLGAVRVCGGAGSPPGGGRHFPGRAS